jgi:hypothetical protein
VVTVDRDGTARTQVYGSWVMAEFKSKNKFRIANMGLFRYQDRIFNRLKTAEPDGRE